MARLRLGLSLLGLLSGACVAFGYDFGEYQAAAGSAGASPMSGKEHGPTEGFEPEGGAGCLSPAKASPEAHAGQPDMAGAGGARDDSIFTTYAAGGAPAPEAGGPGGAGGISSTGAGGEGGACQPRSCAEAEAKCGSLDDGCGSELDCGGCFWWFEQCLENQCAVLLN
jgi:hypothetical protein